MSEARLIATGTANNPGLCGMIPVGVRFAVGALVHSQRHHGMLAVQI